MFLIQSVDSESSTINIVVTWPTITELFNWSMNTLNNNGSSTNSPHGKGQEMRTIPFFLTMIGPNWKHCLCRRFCFFKRAHNLYQCMCGHLTIEDDTLKRKTTESQHLVEIQGDDLADFQCGNFLEESRMYPGNDSMVYLRSGSIQFTIVECIWHCLLIFFSKRSNQSHHGCCYRKIPFNILIQTTIIIYPLQSNSTNSFIAYLGEINASHSFSERNFDQDQGMAPQNLAYF
ncbi:hypothetical protein VP01_4026g1 [Puccinia sorghi]|uniref:Uncharacterized protein n=1 Tax=Puccinia sorghi TaxID=27349 RepID=A0A0L6URR9_9BASI|nr:hypothetical protein VP01_4026g1 [Puccinia sorghi]